jgi:hypothetical protein
LEPLVLLLAAIALGGLIGRLARSRGRGNGDQPRFTTVCATAAAGLFALFCGQELLEGAFAPGHPSGIGGVFGHGGFMAAPISIAVALALTTTLRAAAALVEMADTHLIRARTALVAPSTAEPAITTPPARADWRLEPQAGVVAGRAPPRALQAA